MINADHNKVWNNASVYGWDCMPYNYTYGILKHILAGEGYINQKVNILFQQFDEISWPLIPDCLDMNFFVYLGLFLRGWKYWFSSAH